MNFFISLALATSGLLAAGCVSTGTRQAETASASLREAADGLQDTLPSFDAALLALSALVNQTGPELAPQLKVYRNAVRRLESRALVANAPAVAMQRECLDFFETWNRSRDRIENGSTRMRGLERTLLVGTQFEQARDSLARSRAGFAPFMSDLRDIAASLAADTTPAGLDSIRDLAARVAADGTSVRAALADLSDEFRDLGTVLAQSGRES